jgi:hypothetical protein
MWSKVEYNKMIRNRDKYIWKIKDVVECRSRGSRDRSHMIGVMEFESVVQWRRAGRVMIDQSGHVTRVRSPGRLGVAGT